MNFSAAVVFCESKRMKLLALDESQEIEAFVSTEMKNALTSSSCKQQ